MQTGYKKNWMIKAKELEICNVYLFEPRVFRDGRGLFFESYSQRDYESFLKTKFVQDNVSISTKNVARGLHYQLHNPQGKLVSVISGEVDDIIVDLRKGSSTFGHSLIQRLDSNEMKQMYVPAGFAHGFVVRSKEAIFSYKCTDYYHSNDDMGISFLPFLEKYGYLADDVLLSNKDLDYKNLENLEDIYLPK